MNNENLGNAAVLQFFPCYVDRQNIKVKSIGNNDNLAYENMCCN